MTKEEAKHLSDVLKAYSEGKTIQFKNIAEPWKEINNSKIEELIPNKVQFRIKPEPKYRPYKDAEEFLKAQKEHGPYIQRIKYSTFHIPNFVGYTCIRLSDNFDEYIKYERLLELCKWQDGTSCGVAEE